MNEDNNEVQSTATTSSTTTSTNSSQASETSHRIGEDVSVGYWAYRCDSVQWEKSLGSGYASEYPDAEFLIVNLSVLNNDTSASVLPPLHLVDSEGREYDESSKGIVLGSGFGILKNVNPGVTSHGAAVFDVPPGDYALKVSGGFVSGKTALIGLPYNAGTSRKK